MNERLLWIKYSFYNRMMHVYMAISKWATKRAAKTIRAQEDIYLKATGREI